MKITLPILLLILSCLLFSCKPKTEKRQPTIYYNNQNYKFDDDEIIKRRTKKHENTKHNLLKTSKKIDAKK